MPVPQDAQLVYETARSIGLHLREQDVAPLSTWTSQRWRERGLTGMAQYIELLSADSAAGQIERELLTVQCTTGESYFFRDPAQIDLLATKLLPELMARRSDTRRLRLWSADCANGEEAYTLAMLVHEMASGLEGWQVLILGSDINSEALGRARTGVYRDWSFRALDASRKEHCFRPQGDHWQIDQRLRDSVSFRQVDLVRDSFPDAASDLIDFDLILCRNVFIYLDSDTALRITKKFARSLAEGGYLVTGHSELAGHDTSPLHTHMYPQSAAYQKSSTSAAISSHLWPDPHAAQVPKPVALSSASAIEAKAPVSPQRPDTAVLLSRPDYGQLIRSAQQHFRLGQQAQAEQDCRQAICLSDLDPRPYFLLAQLAQGRDDPAQAETLLRKVIYLDPNFIAAYLELGALKSQAGKQTSARRLWEAARLALKKLPAQSSLAPFIDSSCADTLAYVERLLAK